MAGFDLTFSPVKSVSTMSAVVPPQIAGHVTAANKVQAKQSGKWLTIYGRVLFQHTVAISETYNTVLEYRLGEALGVTFAPRTDPEERRPVGEIVGNSHRGRRGTRTPDILLVREALYQLSYASEAPQEYAIRGGPEKPGRKWKLSR